MQELLDETILLLRKYHIDIERLEEETEHEVTEKIHRNIALLMNDTSVIDYQDTHILYDFIFLNCYLPIVYLTPTLRLKFSGFSL